MSFLNGEERLLSQFSLLVMRPRFWFQPWLSWFWYFLCKAFDIWILVEFDIWSVFKVSFHFQIHKLSYLKTNIGYELNWHSIGLLTYHQPQFIWPCADWLVSLFICISREKFLQHFGFSGAISHVYVCVCMLESAWVRVC